ncbi:MAG: hypothetical protein V7641_3202 [Blastocatellia bacterium]
MVARKTLRRGDGGNSMSNETMGISSIFLLAVVLLLLRHGLMLIGRRRQRPHGVYLLRLNDDKREPDPDTESDSEDAFARPIEASPSSFATPGMDRRSNI